MTLHNTLFGAKQKCPVDTEDRKMTTACEHTGHDMPTHALPITLHICADARKHDCPYYVRIEIDNEYVVFHQGFCGYSFRRATPLEDKG